MRQVRQAMAKSVAVIEFMHESNTFSVLSTDMDRFHGGHYFIGDEIESQFQDTNSEIGGFLIAADEFGWEPVFTVAASAEAGGIVSEAARREITNEAIAKLRQSGPYDGIYIALHGAMVTETSQDGETQFLISIREELGNEIPIAVTFDLHSNIFDEMVRYADIAVSYRTYPHVDMADRAKEACNLLERAMSSEIDPAIVIARPPMLLGCDDGRQRSDGPMLHLQAVAARESNKQGILCISINAGFTDADVEAAGPTVIVCYDRLTTSKSSPELVANKICNEIWDWRDTYDFPIPLTECLTQIDTQVSTSGPLVIADFADNPGSGAYGDCTAIIKSLLDLDVENTAVGALWDPGAVNELSMSKVGEQVVISIGGKTDPSTGGGPITVSGKITALNDGEFIYEGPMYKGLYGQLGPCACLKVKGVEILIVSERIQMLDQNMFRLVGIEPRERSIVVVKSMQHFRAAFEPIAQNIIVTDAGGLGTPNFANRIYKNIRRPVYPLDDGISFVPKMV